MHSIEERSKKYDELLAKAQAVLAKFNPCKVRDGICARGRTGRQNFCCEGCKSLSPTGCTTDPLYCRIWTCDFIELGKQERNEFYEEMCKIYDEAEEYGLLGFRKGKMETLNIGHDKEYTFRSITSVIRNNIV